MSIFPQFIKELQFLRMKYILMSTYSCLASPDLQQRAHVVGREAYSPLVRRILLARRPLCLSMEATLAFAYSPHRSFPSLQAESAALVYGLSRPVHVCYLN